MAASAAATAQPEIPTTADNLEIPTSAANPEIPTATANPEIPTATANPEIPTSAANPEIPAAAANAEIPAATANPEIPTATANPEIPTATANPEIPTATANPEIHASAANPEIRAATVNPEIPAIASASRANEQTLGVPCTQTLRIRSMDTQSTLLRSGTAVTDPLDSQVDEPEPQTEWSQHEALRQLIFAPPLQQASATFESMIEPLDRGFRSLAEVLINDVCLTGKVDGAYVMARLGLPDLSSDDLTSWENLLNVFDSGHRAACAMEAVIRDAREQALTGYQLKEAQAQELRNLLKGHLEKKNVSADMYDNKIKLIDAGLLRFHEDSQLELAAKEKDARMHQDQCVDTMVLIWEKLPLSAKSVLPVRLTAGDDVEDGQDDTAADLFEFDKILENFLQTDQPVKDCSAFS